MLEEGSDRKAVGMSVLIELFMTFAKIGLFTFGGGYAMLSIIEDICVEKKNWIMGFDYLSFGIVEQAYRNQEVLCSIELFRFTIQS